MALPAAHPRFTPEHYLELESAAEIKHEYHAGEILAMSGGTYRHSRICANLISEIHGRLKGSPCHPLESNMRVRLATDDRYVYPDISVVCAEPKFDPLDKRFTTIINPTLIVEVLSESTAAYDRGDKFTAYRELESLAEYVLVSQDRPMVETFLRQADGTWSLAAWREIDAVARLRAMKIEIPLSDIYAGITY